MNLRFLERDGKMVLQSWNQNIREYMDVPTVKEPRKAREWFINPQQHHCAIVRAEFPFNTREYLNGWIKVQEVIETEGDNAPNTDT